jgi:hypothetical protein
MLRELMILRFGRLPQRVLRRLKNISSLEELEKLTRKVVTAGSLGEMGLGRANRDRRRGGKRS